MLLYKIVDNVGCDKNVGVEKMSCFLNCPRIHVVNIVVIILIGQVLLLYFKEMASYGPCSTIQLC